VLPWPALDGEEHLEGLAVTGSRRLQLKRHCPVYAQRSHRR
jgi:hypothetical protein